MELLFENDFLKASSRLKEAESEYRHKNYRETLNILNDSMESCSMSSEFLLSIYLDVIGSALWKLEEHEGAALFWDRALNMDCGNRHAELCLNLLQDRKGRNYFFDVFFEIKMNEFNSRRAEDGYYARFSEFYVQNFLFSYWDRFLEEIDFNSFDELEVIDFFIKLDVFQRSGKEGAAGTTHPTSSTPK